MGFGDNDNAIGELMRFIEMTSRESIFEDVTNVDDFKLKGGLISFYISNLSIEKAIL